MKRPVLKTYNAPKVVKTRESFMITVEVNDLELVFSTDYKYTSASKTEVYAGEEGII